MVKNQHPSEFNFDKNVDTILVICVCVCVGEVSGTENSPWICFQNCFIAFLLGFQMALTKIIASLEQISEWLLCYMYSRLSVTFRS